MAPRPPLARLVPRPDPSDWGLDELLTFAEAAALIFPNGPLSAAALRAAHRRDELWATHVAGRSFTTRAAVDRMIATQGRAKAPGSVAKPRPEPVVARRWSRAFQAAVAEPRRR